MVPDSIPRDCEHLSLMHIRNHELFRRPTHYSDIIMSAMASQITSVSFVCSTFCSSTDQIKHQSSASLAFVRVTPDQGTVTRKMSQFDDVMDYLQGVFVWRAGLLWSQQDFEWRWSVPLFKCLTVLEFSFILFDLCLLITFFNFIMNYVPIVTFWIFTYHKIWILSIMFCFIWSYWIIYFLACLEVSWRVVS